MEIKSFCASKSVTLEFGYFSPWYFGKTVRNKIQRKIKEDVGKIYLVEFDDGSWREVRNYKLINQRSSKLAYFVTQRFPNELCQLERKLRSFQISVYRYKDTAKSVITAHCRNIDDVMWRLSVVEWCSKFLVPVAEIIQVWSNHDGGFLLQLDAETDLHRFVTENRTSDIRVRYCANKLVEWHKMAWQNKLWWHSRYPDDSVVDEDGNVKMIPFWGLPVSKDDPDPESEWVYHCGESLAVVFSDIDDRYQVWNKIDSGYIESVLTGIKEDIASIIRSCLEPEEDRATFSSLLHCLSLNCVTSVSNCLDDADTIEDTVAYTWRGLRTESVVEIIKKKHDTAPENIFILKSDKIMEDIITVDYQPEMTLSYIIIECMAPILEKTEIGRGSFGTVFSCKDQHSNVFAIKELSNVLLKPKITLSFLKEVDIFNQLNHERIVQYLGYFHDSRQSIFVKMELMKTSLGVIVRESRSGLPIEEVRRYTLHIAEGLAYLHSRSIIHRDLKCDNVLVKKGNAKLTDFGLSKVLTSSDIKNPKPQTSLGTVYAMAPEVIADEPHDSSVDIWSLGAAVWEMATGRHCFKGLNVAQIIMKIDRTKSLEHDPNISPEIQTFINLCARSNPRERPTATQLLTDLFLQTP